MRYISPLRYPGGKSILANYVKLLLNKNKLLDGIYVEPFVGGGGIALSLLFNEYVSKIIINDLNRAIYAFWFSVLNYTDDLCDLITNTDVTTDEWFRQKNIQKKQDATYLELGFSTFFLNRTNRSGIINGGMIGGLNQNGRWKIDARFNKKDLVHRIQQISFYRDRIVLYNLDASELIADIFPQLPSKTFIYFDPPYYNKGCDLYQNYFKHEDHQKLSGLIKKLDDMYWMVTYDNNEHIQQMYSNKRHFAYSLSYSAAKRYFGSEIMIFSDKIIIPRVEDPLKIKVL